MQAILSQQDITHIEYPANNTEPQESAADEVATNTCLRDRQEDYDMQQRSPAGVKPEVLWLNSMRHNHGCIIRTG